ncbi:MAG: metallophosphoesterase family protein [Verrucomicrobiales bacterium]|nr:metallophosphoesterase family protein [Verrucomicrobiales bacterium]
MTRAWWLGGLLLTSSFADEVGLVRIGENWRFTRTPPVATSPAWFEPGFDASGWATGPSGFTFASSLYEATSFYGTSAAYGAVLFRHEFTVTDPAAIEWLTLRLDWSGGFILWLNGVEVLRRNLPGLAGEPVPADFEPEIRPRAGTELIDLTEWQPLILEGLNCLAIQWHESSYGGYGSGLLPELLANFVRGPALQAATPTRQTILWHTAEPTDGWVEYAPDQEALETSEITPTGTTHAVTLTGLRPDTEYNYRVAVRSGDRVARCDERSFRTLKDAGPIHFAVTADVGSGLPRQYRVARVLRQLEPDLVIMPGDLVYPHFVARLTDYRWFSVYAEQLRTTPIFVVAGNHDTAYLRDGTYLESFAMPTNSVPLAEQQLTGDGPVGHYCYSFDHGDAHFVGLYVTMLYAAYDLPPDSPQLAWLEEDLAASDKPWKILYLHHPILSSGPHGTDDNNANGLRDSPELAGRLMPIALRHGVQLVFAGHDHIYERFTPVQGILAITAGCGGGSPYAVTRHEPAGVISFFHGHCVDVRLEGRQATLRALDEFGVEFDSFHFNLAPPEPSLLQAARHTPDFGDALPPDRDGNRVGQTFDFAGEPVAGVAGKFSSPGRLWVNVDDSRLHLGLDEIALLEGDDLMLFLGVQGRPGVSTMAGLGNGLPPPDAEGVNALDLLENLAFAPGFEPAVAIVLGDEFADRNDRQFVRTNVAQILLPEAENTMLTRPVSLGQGVFHLKPGFPDVSGTRIEQFDVLCESGTPAHEQAANHAMVSLPLSALGLVGGERLQVGVVVARGDPLVHSGPTGRWLDSGFIGTSFNGRGFLPAELAGLPVELPSLGLLLHGHSRPNGDVAFSWRIPPDRPCRLQQSETATGPFVDVPGQPEDVSVEDARASMVVPSDRLPPRGTRFFRLRSDP